jgi:hypothetical protein
MELKYYTRPQRIRGRFVKGYTPHNKGKKASEWMDAEKLKKNIENLNKFRVPNMKLGGMNKRKVVAIDSTGKFIVFPSLKTAGIYYGIPASNISKVCKGERKFAKGIKFFYEDDNNFIKYLKNNFDL